MAHRRTPCNHTLIYDEQMEMLYLATRCCLSAAAWTSDEEVICRKCAKTQPEVYGMEVEHENALRLMLEILRCPVPSVCAQEAWFHLVEYGRAEAV